MRGRKPENKEAYTEYFVVRLTKKQKDVLLNNKEINKRLIKDVREFTNQFIDK